VWQTSKLPEHEAEMTSQAVMGTPVRVLKMNGWCGSSPDSYLGWTEEASLDLMDEAALLKWRRSDRSYTDNRLISTKREGNSE
jgi:hypothetical protein